MSERIISIEAEREFYAMLKEHAHLESMLKGGNIPSDFPWERFEHLQEGIILYESGHTSKDGNVQSHADLERVWELCGHRPSQ
jgi:hypothetical protein